MKFIVAALCSMIAIIASSSAQPTAASTNADVASPPIWRVSDGDSTLTIVGTFHVLPPGLDWRARPLAAAADRAETVWFEAETDTRLARMTAATVMQKHGTLAGAARLPGLLGPEDSMRLANAAAEIGVPMEQLDTLRPWRAFLVLSAQSIAAQGYDPALGVGAMLLAEARQRGRALRFLETVEEQLSLFTGLAAADEKSLLILTLRDWDKREEDLAATLAAWKSGDDAALDETMNGLLRREAPGAYERLIVARNRAWTPKLAAALDEPGSALVAVGASHLVGPDSLPVMLAAAGYSVERVGASQEN
jgi:uncharacterized protein YbaP (TraB family)